MDDNKSKQFINELKQLIVNSCQEAENATDTINVFIKKTYEHRKENRIEQTFYKFL